jgi:hypothetical protein
MPRRRTATSSPAPRRGGIAPDAPLPPLSEGAMRYLGLILRGEVLTGRLGTVGGLPALLGLHIVEAAVARQAASGHDPLTPADLGATLPGFRRALHLPPLWARVRASREALEALFMTA